MKKLLELLIITIIFVVLWTIMWKIIGFELTAIFSLAYITANVIYIE